MSKQINNIADEWENAMAEYLTRRVKIMALEKIRTGKNLPLWDVKDFPLLKKVIINK